MALLYLVSQFARKLLNGIDRTLPKAIFLDEAWAITSTPEGAKLVPEVSRMGRSRNTALILVSQNAGDLLNEQVTNCLSGVFAFRSTERGEVANVMSLLGVAPSDEHKAVLRSLGNGECIFRDLDDRAGRIGVDLVSAELGTGSIPTPPGSGTASLTLLHAGNPADADAAVRRPARERRKRPRERRTRSSLNDGSSRQTALISATVRCRPPHLALGSPGAAVHGGVARGRHARVRRRSRGSPARSAITTERAGWLPLPPPSPPA